ncbi:hypothetical protein NDI49_29460 [Trichocoleus sp. ST-U3]
MNILESVTPPSGDIAIVVQAINDAIEQKTIALQGEQQRSASLRNQKLIDQWQAEIEALERARKRLPEDGGV